MIVKEFCLTKTQVGELCVFRRSDGHTIGSTLIDTEGLFIISISSDIKDKKVKSDECGYIVISTDRGDKIQVPYVII